MLININNKNKYIKKILIKNKGKKKNKIFNWLNSG
jgi:hypothetical protein